MIVSQSGGVRISEHTLAAGWGTTLAKIVKINLFRALEINQRLATIQEIVLQKLLNIINTVRFAVF